MVIPKAQLYFGNTSRSKLPSLLKRRNKKSAEVFFSELMSNNCIILGLSRKVAIYPCSYIKFWQFGTESYCMCSPEESRSTKRRAVLLWPKLQPAVVEGEHAGSATTCDPLSSSWEPAILLLRLLELSSLFALAFDYGLVHEVVELLSEPAAATCLHNKLWPQVPGHCYLLLLTNLSHSHACTSDPSF